MSNFGQIETSVSCTKFSKNIAETDLEKCVRQPRKLLHGNLSSHVKMAVFGPGGLELRRGASKPLYSGSNMTRFFLPPVQNLTCLITEEPWEHIYLRDLPQAGVVAPPQLCNAIMACRPRHPFFAELIKHLPQSPEERESCLKHLVFYQCSCPPPH